VLARITFASSSRDDLDVGLVCPTNSDIQLEKNLFRLVTVSSLAIRLYPREADASAISGIPRRLSICHCRSGLLVEHRVSPRCTPFSSRASWLALRFAAYPVFKELLYYNVVLRFVNMINVISFIWHSSLCNIY